MREPPCSNLFCGSVSSEKSWCGLDVSNNTLLFSGENYLLNSTHFKTSCSELSSNFPHVELKNK